MKKYECKEHNYSEPPYLGGFCKKHHEEQIFQEDRRKTALRALETGQIEGRLSENRELREELLRLQKWWYRACDAINYNKKDVALADEAAYAAEWGIALAQVIVDAELAHRKGESYNHSWDATRQWVWDRFHNLEAGLMSNGIKRNT